VSSSGISGEVACTSPHWTGQ